MTAQEAQWLNHIIAAEELHVLFQPIVDANQQAIYGYEALIRGPKTSPLHSPLRLFDVATQAGLLVELDLLCRRLAIRRFAELDLPGLLFLNVMPLTIVERDFREGLTLSFYPRERLATRAGGHRADRACADSRLRVDAPSGRSLPRHGVSGGIGRFGGLVTRVFATGRSYGPISSSLTVILFLGSIRNPPSASFCARFWMSPAASIASSLPRESKRRPSISAYGNSIAGWHCCKGSILLDRALSHPCSLIRYCPPPPSSKARRDARRTPSCVPSRASRQVV